MGARAYNPALSSIADVDIDSMSLPILVRHEPMVGVFQFDVYARSLVVLFGRT